MYYDNRDQGKENAWSLVVMLLIAISVVYFLSNVLL